MSLSSNPPSSPNGSPGPEIEKHRDPRCEIRLFRHEVCQISERNLVRNVPKGTHNLHPIVDEPTIFVLPSTISPHLCLLVTISLFAPRIRFNPYQGEGKTITLRDAGQREANEPHQDTFTEEEAVRATRMQSM